MVTNRKRVERLILAISILVTWSPSSALAQLGFGSAMPLNSNAQSDAGSDVNPTIATDKAGTWVAVWSSNDSLSGTVGSDSDIFYTRSVDNGVTWSIAAALNDNAFSDIGVDRHPRVACSAGGTWLVVWSSTEDLSLVAGLDEDIFFSRSEDGGVTWSPPELLNANGTTDSGHDGSPAIVEGSPGNWMCIWSSFDDLGGTIGIDSDIFGAVSVDDGESWGAPIVVNTNADLDSGDDVRPTVVRTGLSGLIVAWESDDTLGGAVGPDSDVFYAMSTDSGDSWGGVQVLNSNASTDLGNDMNPSVSGDGGHLLAVWSSTNDLIGGVGPDFDVHASASTDAGVSWTVPSQVNTNAAGDSGGDTAPVVAQESDGNFVAVWFMSDSLGGTIGTEGDIAVSRTTDIGATWSPIAALNSTAASDSGIDEQPHVAKGLGDRWIAVWSSAENLGGVLGPDHDILFAISDSVPVRLSGARIE